MGGMIGLELALMIPDRFKSIGLLCTAASWKSSAKYPFKYMNMFKMTGTVDENVKTLMDVVYSDQQYLDAFDARFPQFANNRDRIHAILKNRMMVSKKPALATLVGQILACTTHNVEKERLHELGLKIKHTLIICGREDKVTDPSCSEYLATHIPGSKLLVLTGKGHVITSEAEFQVCKELHEMFMASNFL